MQLIKIVNVPIEYKVEIEHARLQLKTGSSPEIAAPDAALATHHKNAQIRHDSLDLNTAGKNAQGVATSDIAINTSVDGSSAEATIVSQVGQKTGEGTTVAAQKLAAAPITPVSATYAPSTGNSVNWAPQNQSVEYQPGAITFDWNKMQGTMQYVPGEISFKILQYPDVQIEYVGGPNYVPPSSAPNYNG